jgi:hypothetical protein
MVVAAVQEAGVVYQKRHRMVVTICAVMRRGLR